LGHATLRFNFRSVGQSVGIHDGGIGETGDALAAIAYMREQWPALPLLLAGFSFGGGVAIRAACQAEPALLVTIAPAVDHVKLEGLRLPRCPWLFVQGAADDVVNPVRVQQWALAHAPAAAVISLPGVGHFFHGKLTELQVAVVKFALQQGKKKPGA
jgi:alpha/beta superfamily hydrolase